MPSKNISRWISVPFTIILVVLAIKLSYAFVFAPNGFDLSGALIDTKKILSGGPEKDGIPALTRPDFINTQQASYLKPEDRVLGIEINGISKAYPISILNWHEIVNDQINNEQFAVTYCPLCGTGVAFSAQVSGKTLEFGVSGLIYNSDVLLYDKATESLWSQIMRMAVSGEFKGEKLTLLPITHTSWQQWTITHPDTLVMSNETGYARDYQRNPYAGYEKSRNLYFQVTNRAPDWFHPKERTLGIEVDGVFKAYPFSELDKTGQSTIIDQFAGQTFSIDWKKSSQQVSITDASGNAVAGIEGFWFAWFTFHPETEVFRAKKKAGINPAFFKFGQSELHCVDLSIQTALMTSSLIFADQTRLC